MMGLLGSLTASEFQRYVIDLAMYFGICFIATLSLNFQYGNAGVPNIACPVSAAIGAYTVSAVVTKVIFWVGTRVGLEVLPLMNGTRWAQHNNYINVEVMNEYIMTHASFGIAMLFLSLALGFAAGWTLGYVISLPALRLDATYLMISLYVISDMACPLGRNILPIAGGTLGMYIPNLLAWYPGDRTILLALLTLSVGIIVYLLLRRIQNSPYGRLMRAVRANGLAVSSVGKDVTSIKRKVVMLGSGITALSGVLLSHYYSFVIEANYHRGTWTYWPWLMMAIGGIGNYSGSFMGCAIVLGIQRLLLAGRQQLASFIWYPVVLIHNQLLGFLIIAVQVFMPRGLLPERPLRIRGVNYRRLIFDEDSKE